MMPILITDRPRSATKEGTQSPLSGSVIACWGSAGAGKTTISVNVAFELASLGHRVILIDLDSYRPSVAALLGLTNPGPGITAALRLARSQRLDMEEVQRLSQRISFGSHSLEVLTGMTSPNRWPELDGPALQNLLELARENFDFIVFDLASELEEGLYSQAASHSRNFPTSEVIRLADVALGIFAADPVGVNRFLVDLRDAGFEHWPIANRVRSSVLGRNPERQLKDTLYQTARIGVRMVIPDDSAAVDIAQQRAQPLLLAARSSKTREGIRQLALELADARES